MTQSNCAVLQAIEYHLPEARVTNDALAEQFPQWTPARIHEIVGVDERHERTWSAFRALFLLFYGESGTAKYAVNTPVSVLALPVISPLLLMSLAFVSFKGKLPLRSFRSVGVLP